MSSRAPKVSVCIPVYNGADYIAESIASVLEQTYRDFRLIVCDNCSTDNTADIVRSVRDPRLTYVRNRENLGVVGNYNCALNLIESEYVCFWHHDDVMLPENLERKVSVLDENPGVGFVHSDIIEIDSESRVLRKWWRNSGCDYIEDGLTFFRRFIASLPSGSMVFIGSVLARRNCYSLLGGYRPELRYTHDSEMWMRMSLFCDVACLGTALVQWRQHRASVSSGLGYGVQWLYEHYLAARIIFSDHWNRIPQWKYLRRQVYASFAERAFKEGWKAYYTGDLAAAKGYLTLAVRVYPQVIGTTNFLRLGLRLAAGPTGVRLYRASRERIRGMS